MFFYICLLHTTRLNKMKPVSVNGLVRFKCDEYLTTVNYIVSTFCLNTPLRMQDKEMIYIVQRNAMFFFIVSISSPECKFIRRKRKIIYTIIYLLQIALKEMWCDKIIKNYLRKKNTNKEFNKKIISHNFICLKTTPKILMLNKLLF